jgi:hypothetical protein
LQLSRWQKQQSYEEKVKRYAEEIKTLTLKV